MMKLKARVGNAIADGITLWKQWNLQGFVVFSLSLQCILFITAPFRRKTSRVILVALVWSAYQLWDTAITRSLALVNSAYKQEPADRAEFIDLYAFWAAFLLLHFGGPDTITALSMEDNNLWRRSWAHFATQLVNTASAVLVVPPEKRFLRPYILISTLLIFCAGLIKSYERILSLIRASFSRFQWSVVPATPDPGTDYAAIVEAHDFYQKAGIPVKFDAAVTSSSCIEAGEAESTVIRELNDAQVVKEAYHFFNKFKGMYVDMVFCCHDRKETRDCFLQLSPEDAFRVLETEMNLAYEAFYSKTPLIIDPPWRYIRCFVFFCLEIPALLLWTLEYKHYFQSIDVRITSCLVAGAVLIDIISVIRIIGSDWRIGRSLSSVSRAPLWISRPLVRLFLCARRPRWGENPKEETSYFQRGLRVFFRKWSESISQFNLINYCVDQRCKCCNSFYSFFGAKDMMDGWKYVFKTWLTNDLREFIFEELRYKSFMAKTLNVGYQITSSRGSWVLRSNASSDLVPATFGQWIMDVEYDESMLIWHIATELCYETEQVPGNSDESRYRQFSKILSDYMLYLLIRQPKLMSQVAPMAEVIFKDTCEEAKQLVHRKIHSAACQRIMQVATHVPPSYIKEDCNNSVLFDACELANKLKGLKNKRPGQWELTSKIWVELLCYAAAQSPAYVHAMLLTAGGELVTLVRLLMLHLGLSNQFRQKRGIGITRKELIIDT